MHYPPHGGIHHHPPPPPPYPGYGPGPVYVVASPYSVFKEELQDKIHKREHHH